MAQASPKAQLDEKTGLSPAPIVARRPIRAAELAAHNSAKSAWITIRGTVYDVTGFVRVHPGGQSMLLYSAGRDATTVFETYHRLAVVRALLASGRIPIVGTLVENELPVFPDPSDFFKAIRSRVAQLFSSPKQDPKNPPQAYIRYLFIFISFSVIYYILYWSPSTSFAVSGSGSTLLIELSLAITLGFVCALIGLHPLHDGSHCAVTHSPWVWAALGATHDFLNGASSTVWIYQHVLGHHPYTNIANADPDIQVHETNDVRRILPSQPWHSFYRTQHYFVPVLYGLLAVKTRLQDVWIMYVARSNGRIRINPMSKTQGVVFWGGKAFFLFYRILAPVLWNQHISLWRAIWFLVVADAVTSYWLALTFQANHVVVDAMLPFTDSTSNLGHRHHHQQQTHHHHQSIGELYSGPQVDENNKISTDWAVCQLACTMDYATASRIWTFATGALNMQAVHHLFPHVAQDNYGKIVPILAETCSDFNVKYLSKPTFYDALGAHLALLKNLGQNLKHD